MIVEVRSYRIKPGKREEFIKLFETRAIPGATHVRHEGDWSIFGCRESEQVCFSAKFSFTRRARAHAGCVLWWRIMEE
jgi:hypothetical protein